VRLAEAESRAQSAIARVREVDPHWRPTPSAYHSVEGLIRANEAEAQEAQARFQALARFESSHEFRTKGLRRSGTDAGHEGGGKMAGRA